MKHQHTSVVDELRQSTRFLVQPETEYAVIWSTPGHEILAEVHDESLGGLALVVNECEEMRIGDVWEITYLSRVYSGVVKHVEHRPDGARLVGFHCEVVR